MSLLSLPDDILINILSRLNTIDASKVQGTCWRLHYVIMQRKLNRIEANHVSIGLDLTNEPLLRMAVHPTFILPELTHKIVYNMSLQNKSTASVLEELFDKVKSAKVIYLSDLCINEALVKMIADHSTIKKQILELGLNKCSGNETTIRRLVDILGPQKIAVSLSTFHHFQNALGSKNDQENSQFTYKRGKRTTGDEFIYYIRDPPIKSIEDKKISSGSIPIM